MWEDVPSPYPHAKLHGCGFKKYGLTGAKIAKIGNFWYKFSPKGYIPLSDFYTKFGMEEGVGNLLTWITALASRRLVDVCARYQPSVRP